MDRIGIFPVVQMIFSAKSTSEVSFQRLTRRHGFRQGSAPLSCFTLAASRALKIQP